MTLIGVHSTMHLMHPKQCRVTTINFVCVSLLCARVDIERFNRLGCIHNNAYRNRKFLPDILGIVHVHCSRTNLRTCHTCVCVPCTSWCSWSILSRLGPFEVRLEPIPAYQRTDTHRYNCTHTREGGVGIGQEWDELSSSTSCSVLFYATRSSIQPI